MYSRPFGETADGRPVTEYFIDNGVISLSAIDYGCAVRTLKFRGRDVVLGYDSIAEYERNEGFMGAVVGRVANRIAGGAYVLNGKSFHLPINDNPNHLHGGSGYHTKMWTASFTDDGIVFFRTSPSGEDGYGGRLDALVVYSLRGDKVIITFDVSANDDTPACLTSHCYFNLSECTNIENHSLTIFSNEFCEIDSSCLPTGKMLSVERTPFDFRKAKKISAALSSQFSQNEIAGGLDHCFALSDTCAEKRAARLTSEDGKLSMIVYTDYPGLQVYSGNSLYPRRGKDGKNYVPRGGICLEPQFFPNAVNCPAFLSPAVAAGSARRNNIILRFDTAWEG